MQSIRTRFRDRIDYITHASTVLRSEHVLLDPELLGLIYRRRVHDGVPRAVTVPVPVELEAGVTKSRATKGERRCVLIRAWAGELRARVEALPYLSSIDARQQSNQQERCTIIQWELCDLLFRHVSAYICVGCIQWRGLCCHNDLLIYVSNGQGNVLH